MSQPYSLTNEIERVLRKARQPLSSRMILDEIEMAGYVNIKGRTPLKTINARILEEMAKNGDESVFQRVGRAIYTIRKWAQKEYTPPSQDKKYSTSYSKMVLTFPTEYLNTAGYFHGVRKDHRHYIRNILSEKNNPAKAFYVTRRDAEKNYQCKQIVSYVIVKFGDKILRHKRGARTSVSSYLRGKYSIGFGGHLEHRDALPLFQDTVDFGYRRSVQRELYEELKVTISDSKKLSAIGILNDESVQEGKKHLALIHLVELNAKAFKKNERWINDLKFVDINKLYDDFEEYEYWSKLCILSFFGNQLPSSHVSIKEDFKLKSQADLILIVGQIRSGKSEACALLEKEFGYTLVQCSRIMQELIGCEPIEKIGRTKLQNEGYKFINQKDGHERLAQGIVDFVRTKKNVSNKFVFDGLRYPETLKAIKARLDSRITVLYVDTMNDSLYRNHKNRDTEILSFDDFMRTVYHPVERSIAQFRPPADITVYNHGSLHSYLNKLRIFFQKEL
jgi:predicted NUDIX family phosphoesterase